jgi:hypothetical protein
MIIYLTLRLASKASGARNACALRDATIPGDY